MKLCSAIVLFSFLAAGCANTNGHKDPGSGGNSLPPCLASQVESFNKKEVKNIPLQIDEYMYRGKRGFLITADCCDQFNTFYDENCQAVCSPSGGFEGGGDHRCEDFSKEAKFVKQVWKKPSP